METQNTIAAIHAKRQTLEAQIKKIQSELENLAIAQQVILALASSDPIGSVKAVPLRPSTIKDRVLRILESGEALVPKDILAKLAAEGQFKYASVLSDLARMKKAGILGQEDGKYFLAQKGETPHEGGVSNAA